VTWAAMATFTCYFGGMIMAVVMTNSGFKSITKFRAIFILPYAVPAVISMLVWRNMLNGAFGTINRTLMELGWITTVIPWLSDEWLAKFTTVTINLWAGFPYFMLLTMGSMTAINEEMFEAAKVDGANKFQLFRHITFPMVTFQTMPLIIMSFSHNINNFGAIFFLTGGNSPAVDGTTVTGARGADILITWIYRLTMSTYQYSFAAVLAVLIFVILAPFAIFQFMRTKSFKEGEL
jgi:arabinogalactan oligomer/maltooligosaccharide transport system permease protein